MKWVAFIFSYVILIQAFWPCSDGMLPETHTTRYEQHAQQEHKKDTGSDQCTPFCSCSCCATPSIVQLSATFAITLTRISPVYKEYTPSEFRGVAMTVWQPPRLNA
ncbi:DUF6660 family protein [Chitinophaga sancti]|uniref:DUF6660 family protein n=1 Tax=Chitinophaga sancti TaxID=1004 RepID=UPI003F7B2052